MAYDNAGLKLLVPGMSGGPNLWYYSHATDDVGDIDAADYFSDGADFGLKANDIMIVVDIGAPTCTVHLVENATTINPATLA